MKELIEFKSYPVSSVLNLLLEDKTTKQNIIFATDSYLEINSHFTYETQITSDLLAGADPLVFQPRITKELSEQAKRTKKRAEVFTPSWICNKMNNYCDEEWFGSKDVFNKEEDKSWVVNEDKINFPGEKTWKDYVLNRRLEITCGEAPYIVSRYDASTGEIIVPLNKRIGFLDRKLRAVNENTKNEKEWLEWTIKAFQSVYGYEFQGDNLLIARINLLITFTDYLKDKWDRYATIPELKKIANIICWNFWQMDGLTGNVPFKPQHKLTEQLSIFDEPEQEDDPIIGCRIKDWQTDKSQLFNSLKGEN